MNGRLLRWLLALAHAPRAGTRASSLTIVRHHRVYGAGERPLYRLGVSEAVFEGQLAMLAAAGLAPVTVREGLAWLASGERGHRVAMSFDDGYADNVTRALPLLARHGARATFYLAAGLMEERRATWWDVLAHAIEHGATIARAAGGNGAGEVATPEARARLLAASLGPRERPEAQRGRLERLRERLGVREEAPCELATWDLAARLPEAGMEVGAHTLSHPFLGTLSRGEQEAEIGGSRDLIARRLGVTPVGLAYPGGDYDAGTVAACAALGLAYAVTTRAGDVAPGDAPYELRRRGLSEGACLGPTGRFSSRLARAELDGAFDRLRRVPERTAA